ncbi:hypothetical protein BLNAU_1498 [Blattamonas nauphoetae]|uniref:Uncharacterized protein n=1 Tax=Blattamonas nauphoetae TaxID=2049346 RepID=A0ABQ9YIH4_9EUKA|nr:hypothetical protein BLNAU_1498 [Blattamonas nauphoetae]
MIALFLFSFQFILETEIIPLSVEIRDVILDLTVSLTNGQRILEEECEMEDISDGPVQPSLPFPPLFHLTNIVYDCFGRVWLLAAELVKLSDTPMGPILQKTIFDDPTLLTKCLFSLTISTNHLYDQQKVLIFLGCLSCNARYRVKMMEEQWVSQVIDIFTTLPPNCGRFNWSNLSFFLSNMMSVGYSSSDVEQARLYKLGKDSVFIPARETLMKMLHFDQTLMRTDQEPNDNLSWNLSCLFKSTFWYRNTEDVDDEFIQQQAAWEVESFASLMSMSDMVERAETLKYRYKLWMRTMKPRWIRRRLILTTLGWEDALEVRLSEFQTPLWPNAKWKTAKIIISSGANFRPISAFHRLPIIELI